MKIFKKEKIVNNNDLYFYNEKLPSKIKLVRKINTLTNEKEYLESIIKESLYNSFFDTLSLEEKSKNYKRQIKKLKEQRNYYKQEYDLLKQNK